jgi:hypothetical protein
MDRLSSSGKRPKVPALPERISFPKVAQFRFAQRPILRLTGRSAGSGQDSPACPDLVRVMSHTFGVSRATTVSPPRFRASSIENSARLIKSVTMSSLS